MNKRIAALAGTLMLVAAGSISASSVAAAGEFQLESTIAFSSTRDHVSEGLTRPLLGAEVYLTKPVMNETWALTNPRRLTSNASFDGFANLAPDGKKIVFDSTLFTGQINSSDLFLMNTDGTKQTLLTRGSSATWSPDSKNIAFNASASYYASGGLVTGDPIRTDVGSATTDSDIFVANVDDLLAGVEQPMNITNSPGMIDDDPDWFGGTVPTSAPDGQTIVFTSHPVSDPPNPSNQTELYLMNPDGTRLLQLTDNDYEERAPAWAPDGSRIVFSCRIGGGTAVFQICVMNAALNPDGTLPTPTQLTDNDVSDLTATFSPDGQQILFHKRVAGAPLSGNQQLFIMNATLNADGTLPTPTQLTFGSTTSGDGVNNIAHWGELRVPGTP